MLRRSLLKYLAGSSLLSYGLLHPLRALAKWNEAAFSAVDLATALENYYPGQTITQTDKIIIGVRPEIENGAVVPIKITTDLPAVESIAIFVDNNPNPLIANFDLSPACKGFVSTRIKVDQPSDIHAVVKSAGKVYSNKTSIIVHEGGCG